MNNAFAHATGAHATAAHMSADARFLPRSVPSRPPSKRLRPSQQPTDAPIRGADIDSSGMRPSQVAVVRSGDFAAIPPTNSAVVGRVVDLRSSRSGSLREGNGSADLRVQR